MLKTIYFLVLMLVLSGCAQNVWFKQNANNGEFERDRYECLQNAQQRVGSAQINAYGGSAVNTVATNDGLFSACMGAKGWRMQNKEATQNQISQLNADQTTIKQGFDQLNSKLFSMCGDSEFREYYKKTSCKASEVSFEHLADTTKITENQKIALVKQRERLSALEKEQDALQMQLGINGQKMIEVAQGFNRPKNEENNLDLYLEKVTWGEYNKRRKEIFIESQRLLRK